MSEEVRTVPNEDIRGFQGRGVCAQLVSVVIIARRGL